MYHKITICTFIFFFGSIKAKLPPTINICKRNDPNISDCIIKSIQLIQSRLATGDLGPGLQIPPQEPLKIDDIVLEDIGARTVLTNLTLHGGSQFNIEKLKVNMADLNMDTILVYPKLEMTGNYKFMANFFGAPINNEGDMLIKITNSVNRISIQMEKYVKEDGREYLRFRDVSLKIKSSKPSSVELKGASQSQTLNQVASALVQENPLFSVERIAPFFEKSLSESMNKVANNIVSSATYEEVFPL